MWSPEKLLEYTKVNWYDHDPKEYNVYVPVNVPHNGGTPTPPPTVKASVIHLPVKFNVFFCAPWNNAPEFFPTDAVAVCGPVIINETKSKRIYNILKNETILSLNIFSQNFSTCCESNLKTNKFFVQNLPGKYYHSLYKFLMYMDHY